MADLANVYRRHAGEPAPRGWIAEVRVYSVFGQCHIIEAGRSRWLWLAWFYARYVAWCEDARIPPCGEIGIDWRVRALEASDG